MIAVDSGGTFSDCVVVDPTGRPFTGKSPSTPPDFSSGILESVSVAAETLGTTREDILSKARFFFGHGTTVATNALINRKGVRTGLLTTKGHEDVMAIGRVEQKVAGLTEEERIKVYALGKPEPLVPRHLVRGVPERTDCMGATVVELDEDAVRGAARELVEDEEVEAIAVCFLWSFLNPTSERRVTELIRADHPDVAISLSSDIAPLIKEYERTATTVINAYLTPVVEKYLDSLQAKLREAMFNRSVMIMQDSGGVSEATRVSTRPVQLLNSGPVGGMNAAKLLAGRLGHENVVTADMGGTSFDVGLLVEGEPLFARSPSHAQYRVLTPAVDLQSIGAGGGSIASIEAASGLLKVGPTSAGADPGPICYRRGGTAPTVTDANLVLNRIDGDRFWGGRLTLDRDASEAAIADQIAKPLGLDVFEAAAGIVRIVDSHMADLIRRLTVSRGHNPRDFVVYAFGGAGPLHSSAFAKQIGAMPLVVVPALSSVFSAYGMAASDVGITETASVPMIAPFDGARVTEAFEAIEAKVSEELSSNNIDEADMELVRTIELRYRGQIHEVPVPVPSGTLSDDDAAQLVAAFEGEYERIFGKGTGYREAGIEARTFTVRGTGQLGRPEPSGSSNGHPAAAPEPDRHREVYFEEEKSLVKTPIYLREQLKAGAEIKGPAMVEAVDTTILVRPDDVLRVDAEGNCLIPVNA
ncbi:MAG TPA: hydantoinase/oxoprolinase family protein [Solirubrobacterales bacterium]|jgi:N-methylhydantoinase A